MSAIYTRFVKAAQLGRSVIEFNQMVEKIEVALRSGDASVFRYSVETEAIGLDLVARLESENVPASLVKTETAFCVQITLAPFFEIAKPEIKLEEARPEIKLDEEARPEIKLDENARPAIIRFRVDSCEQTNFIFNYLRGKSHLKLHRLYSSLDLCVEFELDTLKNGEVYEFEFFRPSAKSRLVDSAQGSCALINALCDAGFVVKINPIEIHH